MGQPKTKTVGGGAARGVATDWNNMLNGFMQTGAFKNALNTSLAGQNAGDYSQYFEGMKTGGGGVPNFAGMAGTPQDLMNVDINSPEFAALRQYQDRTKMADVANIRARFGAMGAGGRGTGAANAEATYLAEANPRNIMAQNELMRSIQGMDLQNRQVNQGLLDRYIGNQGLENAYKGLQAQTGLNLMGNNANILQLMAQAFMQANQLGTPGAQTIQIPNTWQQTTQGLGDIGTFISSFTGGGR